VSDLTDAQLLRYARHILLDEFGIEGQESVSGARALVIGAGGLGSSAAYYLAGAGLGHIVLADDDVVELSNLQRQILHTSSRVDAPKAISGQEALQALNPDIRIEPVVARLEGAALEAQVAAADIVLDCCDNFATRHAVNHACVKFRKPLVSGAAIRFSGQVSVYDMRSSQAPCYHCLFPDSPDVTELRCATTGVLGPLVGIIGSVQAAEALKLLADMGEPLVGRLLCLDALTMQWQTVRFRPDPACPVCATKTVPESAGAAT